MRDRKHIMKTAVLTMARMASTRLPGKVLMPLDNKPTLQHVVERCRRAKRIHDVIVVCTTDPKDIAIIDFCESKGYKYFPGKGDVIDQMISAAEYHNVDYIVDVTADCPLVDPRHIDILIEQFFKKKVMYASNLLPRTFPDGMDIQIYRRETLEVIDNIIPRKTEKRRNSGWNIAMLTDKKDMWTLKTSNPNSSPHIRLTLDEKKDYELLKYIFRYFGHNKFRFIDILNLLQKKPELKKINMDVKSSTPGLGVLL